MAASVEELEGRSMLAYVGLLVLGSLLLSEATGVFAWGLSAAILARHWGGLGEVAGGLCSHVCHQLCG